MESSDLEDDDWDLVVAPPSSQSTGDYALRRTPPLVSPTLRATVQPMLAPNQVPPVSDSTSHRITYESLARRPRSNPRSRTPRRYESPLSAGAFRREAQPASPLRTEGQRITVRLLAGAAVGTIPATTARRRALNGVVEQRPTAPSSKQGPSHRKVRRWNNDSFTGLASELAKASPRGASVAEVFCKAQAEAPLYRSVYNPAETGPSSLTRLMNDKSMRLVQDEFCRGEIGNAAVKPRIPASRSTAIECTSPEMMMNRIDQRLGTIVTRACSNSPASMKTIDDMERCLVQCFDKGEPGPMSATLGTSLLEPPTVTIRQDSQRTTVRFYFDSCSSAGGFHRLLLHAVCQFHGLHAVSTTIDMCTNSNKTSRLLTVTGCLSGAEVRLSDYAGDREGPDLGNRQLHSENLITAAV